FTANSAVAHADNDKVSSDAIISGFDAGGTSGTAAASLAFRRQAAVALRGPLAARDVQASPSDSAAVHVDSLESHTRGAFKDASTLAVTATALLKGVHLMGGAIAIDSVSVSSSFTTDGRSTKDHQDKVTMGAVTVQGQPATIDQ